MARDEGLERLLEAYKEAWASRESSGDTSHEILQASLRAHRVDEMFIGRGPGWGLLARSWDRGVRPDRLRPELARAARRLLARQAKPLIRSYMTLARILMTGEKADLSWLEIPEGRRRLSDDRKSLDLVLRYFHKRAEQVVLPFVLMDVDKVLREGSMPSANQREADEYPVWLELAHTESHAAVMVGSLRVGDTELSMTAWADLHHEAEHNVYADGRLILPWDGPREPVLRCWLPKR